MAPVNVKDRAGIRFHDAGSQVGEGTISPSKIVRALEKLAVVRSVPLKMKRPPAAAPRLASDDTASVAKE